MPRTRRRQTKHPKKHGGVFNLTNPTPDRRTSRRHKVSAVLGLSTRKHRSRSIRSTSSSSSIKSSVIQRQIETLENTLHEINDKDKDKPRYMARLHKINAMFAELSEDCLSNSDCEQNKTLQKELRTLEIMIDSKMHRLRKPADPEFTRLISKTMETLKKRPV